VHIEELHNFFSSLNIIGISNGGGGGDNTAGACGM
jgi:hypothetical protein